MKRYYAGIGSRETPEHIRSLMTKIATYLCMQGYTLRSGGAFGADHAFSIGCNKKQLFVPWNDYNNLPLEYPIPQGAYEMASQLHPNWLRLSNGAKALMARNCMQICGPMLNSNSSFVICWTKDGCINEATRSNKTGGTGQAIALASRLNIPVFNLSIQEHFDRFSFLL